GLTALSAEFTIGEGELMAHDVPLGCAPDEYDDLISGTCSHLPSETLSFINHLGSRTGAAVDMPLSNREVTVLRYLANGLSNKEIAEQLLLSNKTISAHKSNIYSKLGVQSIVELIDYAKAHELL
ncbi:LuxR C-terminal-related transcriptional regulator, partial [Enterobacter cloacae complex sp. 2024EL-00214]|uniref:LuxR C-terminal-related transcriptional regulator n=1 Tax=Enterobacter cloacae complex sp. 2024EL-00214 TaxID=3374268 RepID=UPI003750FFFD